MILTGTELVAPALRWSLPYLEENMGSSKHTVYISKSRVFLYFDDKKVRVHEVYAYSYRCSYSSYLHNIHVPLLLNQHIVCMCFVLIQYILKLFRTAAI